MQATQLGSYRERLLDMRDSLNDDIGRRIQVIPEIAIPVGESTSVPTHPGDEASDGLDAEMVIDERQHEILAQVEDALRRIDNGVYGACMRCGKDIKRARLDAIPYTAYCIDCERLREEGRD